MARVVCDFQFDDHTYVAIAGVDARGTVTSLRAPPMQKGPCAQKIIELAEMFSAFIADGVAFADVADMPALSPLAIAMVSGVTRCVRSQRVA